MTVRVLDMLGDWVAVRACDGDKVRPWLLVCDGLRVNVPVGVSAPVEVTVPEADTD